jgi:hypothetical protein
MVFYMLAFIAGLPQCGGGYDVIQSFLSSARSSSIVENDKILTPLPTNLHPQPPTIHWCSSPHFETHAPPT